MREFHHVGLPTDEQQPGEVYVAETKVWVTNPYQDKYHVEYLRFEPDSPVTGPVRELPHIAFHTDTFDQDIAGKTVLLGPFNVTPTMRVVFIEHDGAVVEFMEFGDISDTPWG